MKVEFPNIRHLRAFREVAQQGSVSAASGAVFLSQPAITQALAKLEERLGVDLFERFNDGMELSVPGAMFLQRVDRLLGELEAGVAEAIELQDANSGAGFAGFARLLTATQLRALVALSKAKNFTIAARNIGISQPSIHRAGRDLEKLAGFALFQTTSQGIALTSGAKALARRVGLAAAELQQGLFEIEAWKGRDSARITVGSMPLARSSILPRSIHRLLTSKSGVQIRTIEGVYGELLQGLRYGEIDFLLGALREPLVAQDVVQERVFDDTLAIVAGAGHPLCGRRKLKIQDTLKYPWIAPPKSTPAGSYLSDILGIPDLAETPVNVVSSSLGLIRGLMLEGDYVTILSRNQIQSELEQGILVALSVDLSDSLRPIGITTRKDWQPTPTQLLFLNIVRDSADEII